MGLPETIRRLRKEKGWSQTDLAERIGAHLSHVNRLETGKYQPSLDVLRKLAAAFGTTLDELANDQPATREIHIEDKTLSERMKLLETLDVEDRQAVLRVIDSMLTKQRILQLVTGTSAPAT